MKHKKFFIIIFIFALIISCGTVKKIGKVKQEEKIIKEEEIKIETKTAKKEKNWNELSIEEKKKRNKSVELANKGNKELEAGNYKNAIKYFNDALLEWELPDAYIGLGNAYYKNEEYQKSILAINEYLQYEINKYSPYYVKGLCYLKLQNLDEALNSFLQAYKLNSTDPEILVNIANIYFEKKS
jgi:tetratricopeptide (TPR) repeat protein